MPEAIQIGEGLVMDAMAQYMKDIGRDAPRFTREQERKLWAKVLHGREARDKLAASVLPWAIRCAKKWRAHYQIKDPLEDVVQSASVAVLKVLDGRFDPARGRLTTCVDHYIRHEAQMLAGRDDVIHVPIYLKNKNRQSHPNQPYAKKAKCCFSLDYTGKLADGKQLEPVDQLIAREDANENVLLLARVRKCMELYDGLSGIVTERNQKIFMRYVEGGVTYRELAEQHGVTYQRIEQIINGVLKVLAGLNRKQLLDDMKERCDVG